MSEIDKIIWNKFISLIDARRRKLPISEESMKPSPDKPFEYFEINDLLIEIAIEINSLLAQKFINRP